MDNLPEVGEVVVVCSLTAGFSQRLAGKLAPLIGQEAEVVHIGAASVKLRFLNPGMRQLNTLDIPESLQIATLGWWFRPVDLEYVNERRW
jgi:hypothetical protein